MLRGINKQSIFEDDEDKNKYLQTLDECKRLSNFKVYAYCFMDNHIHLLLKIEKEDLNQIFKRIGARYVYWYNWKYKRSGHLFQDRFKSEVVEDESYFLTVLRYILQNPKKAGLCKNLEDYKWSSYSDYIEAKGITDTEFALGILSVDKDKQIDEFNKYVNEENEDKCLDIEEIKKRITDEELRDIIYQKFQIKPMMIQNEPRDKMESILKIILEIDGVSTRQLSRVTGVPTNIIWKL